MHTWVRSCTWLSTFISFRVIHFISSKSQSGRTICWWQMLATSFEPSNHIHLALHDPLRDRRWLARTATAAAVLSRLEVLGNLIDRPYLFSCPAGDELLQPNPRLSNVHGATGKYLLPVSSRRSTLLPPSPNSCWCYYCRKFYPLSHNTRHYTTFLLSSAGPLAPAPLCSLAQLRYGLGPLASHSLTSPNSQGCREQTIFLLPLHRFWRARGISRAIDGCS